MYIYLVIVKNNNTGCEKVSREAFTTLEEAKESIRHKGNDYAGEEFRTEEQPLGWFGWTYFGKNNCYKITDVRVEVKK